MPDIKSFCYIFILAQTYWLMPLILLISFITNILSTNAIYTSSILIGASDSILDITGPVRATTMSTIYIDTSTINSFTMGTNLLNASRNIPGKETDKEYWSIEEHIAVADLLIKELNDEYSNKK